LLLPLYILPENFFPLLFVEFVIYGKITRHPHLMLLNDIIYLLSMQLTMELAELLGMHAGDGTLYRASKRTTSGLVWELRGNLDEKEFYESHVIPLIAQLGFTLQGHYRSGGKNGCYGVRCCKREFVNLFINYGFTPGTKTKIVCIPEVIKKSTTEIKSAFLRGLFATDGSVYLARHQNNIPYYPVVEFVSASELLRNDVRQLLQELEIGSHIWTYLPKQRGGPAYFCRINGLTKLRKFHQTIGFSNPKHLKRVITLL
jgi:hypothetical protein